MLARTHWEELDRDGNGLAPNALISSFVLPLMAASEAVPHVELEAHTPELAAWRALTALWLLDPFTHDDGATRSAAVSGRTREADMDGSTQVTGAPSLRIRPNHFPSEPHEAPKVLPAMLRHRDVGLTI